MNNLRWSALFAAGVLAGLVGSARADVVPSPADDLLLAANGGVAAQSTTSQTWGGPADLANDGNRAGNFFEDMSTTHNGDDPELGWLEVTIPAATTIGKVIVWNRTDCCEARVNPFEIQIFNGADKVFTTGPRDLDPDNPDQFIETSTSGAKGYEFAIDPPVLGDRVRIEHVGDRPDFLHLAELEAYASGGSP